MGTWSRNGTSPAWWRRRHTSGAGGWEAVRALRRARGRWAADDRILGAGPFVERLFREVRHSEAQTDRTRRRVRLEGLLGRVCGAAGVPREALEGGGPRPAVTRAREGITYRCVEIRGRSAPPLAAAVGVRPAPVNTAAYPGAGAFGPVVLPTGGEAKAT